MPKAKKNKEKDKKKDNNPQTSIIPTSTNDNKPAKPVDFNSLMKSAFEATADKTKSKTKLPGGTVNTETTNYSPNTQEVKVTMVKDTDKKKDLQEDVKKMKADGKKMEDIADTLNMSTSYAYKLARDKK